MVNNEGPKTSNQFGEQFKRSAIALILTSIRSCLHQLYTSVPLSLKTESGGGVENETESIRIPGHHNVFPVP